MGIRGEIMGGQKVCGVANKRGVMILFVQRQSSRICFSEYRWIVFAVTLLA